MEIAIEQREARDVSNSFLIMSPKHDNIATKTQELNSVREYEKKELLRKDN